jgi:hypothetical protein
MDLRVAHDPNGPSQAFHNFPLRDSFLGVVRSFAMNVGTEFPQNALCCHFIKDHNVVDAFQSCDKLATRLGVENRSTRTLESGNRAVAVDSDHQNIPLLPGALQVAHVSHV